MSEGVLFPSAADGTVSTTDVGKEILATSVRHLDAAVAESILKEKHWRDDYPKHFMDALCLHVQTKDAALSGAQKAIDYIYQTFSYKKGDETIPFAAVTPSASQHFSTDVFSGTVASGTAHPSISVHGKQLTNEHARKMVHSWLEQGLLESSAYNAVDWVIKNEKIIQKNMENVVFVVFGAGSALGPFTNLVKLGAQVAALDLPIDSIYSKIINTVKNSNGKVYIPSFKGNLGCNLTCQIPEIARWLIELEPGKKLILGNYAYADGAAFIKVVLAMDCIGQLVKKHRPDTALAYLCSPTDCFKVADECREDSQKRYEVFSLSKVVRPVLNKISHDRFMSPNYNFSPEAKRLPALIDNFILQQGPNYALAKRIQHWRAMLFHENGDCISSNIAPASSTESVTKNFLLKAAYGGTKFFCPVQIFEPEAANSLMTLLLLHDIFTTPIKCDHPLDFFISGSVHGGMWRNPYRVRSVSEIAALLYIGETYGSRALLLGAFGYLTVNNMSKL